jgi:hypothetical protein
MSYSAVSSHRSMVFDDVRNDAYFDALRRVVTPSSVVLDLGAGMGVLGMMAARLGARRVFLVEPEDVIAVASEIVRANGLDAIVRCVRGRIEDVDLPERADVIVSVFTGNFLVNEDLLPSLFAARDKVLAPGGVLLPSAGTMEAVPVMAADLHGREVARWNAAQPNGLDVSVGRAYAANSLVVRADGLREAEWLADAGALCTIDFTTARTAAVNVETAWTITKSGVCHGWLGWFSVDLAGVAFSTSPRAPKTHWSPVFLPIDPPLEVEAGEQVVLSLERPPFGEWTWRMRSSTATRSHSTLLAMPLAPETMRRFRADHVPALTPRGQAMRDALTAADAGLSVGAIAAQLRARYPGQFPNDDEALVFTRSMIKSYA